MAWFKKKSATSAPIAHEYSHAIQIPREHQHPGDWIVVPFRFAEAARLSIHTIGSQEEVPAAVRFWIAQWLADYNYHLVTYMKEYYGAEILPLLDRITDEVKPSDDSSHSEPRGAHWDHWESQFKEES